MCGIIGYIGKKQSAPFLIDGLKALEYRGYDSAGISIIENNIIKTIKDKGRVSNIEKIVKKENLNSNIGIGHTRWATHGIASKTNSHPHLNNKETISVVHNGIIENYEELKKELQLHGYKFLSETDSEIIPNLIDFYYRDDFLSAVISAAKKLEGSFAIEIISPLFGNKIITIRKNSPIVIGKGVNENYIASDVPAIINFTNEFYFLNDNEIAVLSDETIDFYDFKLNKLDKKSIFIDSSNLSNDKGLFEDFMLKEIFEQPTILKDTISKYYQNNLLDFNIDIDFSKFDKIFIVACGSAMHAGLSNKYLLEKLLNIPVQVEIASEFRYQEPIINEKTLSLFISQSGETADTIAALKHAKSHGSTTISIVNVPNSSITRVSDYTIYTSAGLEIAVASTKAYTSQVVLIGLLGLYIANKINEKNENYTAFLQEIMQIPSKVETCLELNNKIKSVANEIYKSNDVYFIGRGIDFASSLEGSLKLKEITYIHSESYPAGELKHGPIALIEENTPVIGVITDPKTSLKTFSNIQEVLSRGAKTILITNTKLNIENQITINIPKINEYFSTILAVVPMQLLAYHVSKLKKLDVDKPRNLAKSITVE